MVLIVSRGKALLPLHSGVARLFLVRVPNLYFGSIQYSWGTWLGSSAQREAQPDRRGLQWLPHLKYTTISGFPSDRWWYTDIPLRCTRSPLQRWIHNHGSPQSSWRPILQLMFENCNLEEKRIELYQKSPSNNAWICETRPANVKTKELWQKECSTLICGLCWSVLHDLLPLVVFNLMMTDDCQFVALVKVQKEAILILEKIR